MPSPEETTVLQLLAKEWDMTGPPGILDVRDVVTAAGLAPSASLAAVNRLFETGLVDKTAFEVGVFLTPEGYDAAKNIST